MHDRSVHLVEDPLHDVALRDDRADGHVSARQRLGDPHLPVPTVIQADVRVLAVELLSAKARADLRTGRLLLGMTLALVESKHATDEA